MADYDKFEAHGQPRRDHAGEVLDEERGWDEPGAEEFGASGQQHQYGYEEDPPFQDHHGHEDYETDPFAQEHDGHGSGPLHAGEPAAPPPTAKSGTIFGFNKWLVFGGGGLLSVAVIVLKTLPMWLTPPRPQLGPRPPLAAPAQPLQQPVGATPMQSGFQAPAPVHVTIGADTPAQNLLPAPPSIAPPPGLPPAPPADRTDQIGPETDARLTRIETFDTQTDSRMTALTADVTGLGSRLSADETRFNGFDSRLGDLEKRAAGHAAAPAAPAAATVSRAAPAKPPVRPAPKRRQADPENAEDRRLAAAMEQARPALTQAAAKLNLDAVVGSTAYLSSGNAPSIAYAINDVVPGWGRVVQIRHAAGSGDWEIVTERGIAASASE